MKKIDANIKVLMAIIVLLGLSLSVMAQQQSRHQQFQQKEKSALGILNLTEEQKSEIKEIHLTQLKEVQPLKDELLINKAKINALVNKDTPDMKEIVSLVEANGKILTDIQVKEIASKINVRGLLNEEQKVMFDAHSGKMQKKSRQHHTSHDNALHPSEKFIPLREHIKTGIQISGFVRCLDHRTIKLSKYLGMRVHGLMHRLALLAQGIVNL